ncbi:MAG TPA: LL-diaminopimelate aminotransferase [Bacillota bacterium]|jgi:LL-diaminopimelate aminotransferase|nr:LL-diaminopimelate aminotransferase [Bacillota bacterium]
METAQRIKALPPYLFAQIDKKIAEAKARGVDVISFGIGDPDLPTPEHIVKKLQEKAADPSTHRYPSYEGLSVYREAVANWYKRRFGVELNPDTEVVSLIGSKEGIAHLPLCYVDPGDVCLVPDPAYPVYAIGVLFAGGESYKMPLLEENGFLPDLEAIPADVAKKAKILYLNYPNNPTGAVADKEFFQKAVEFAKTYDIIVCHDAAYTEIAFDGYKPISFLEVPGAMDVGIEFHSLSKTYNMTGWRVGWAAGNADIVSALGRIKTNIDSGIFEALQYAGIEALEGSQDCIDENMKVYTHRRDLLVEGLKKLGWPIEKPKATIYVWAPVPAGMNSTDFAALLLDKAGVVVTPGIGYGESGEGYFRMSLTLPTERLEEGLRRIEEAGIRYA